MDNKSERKDFCTNREKDPGGGGGVYSGYAWP